MRHNLLFRRDISLIHGIMRSVIIQCEKQIIASRPVIPPAIISPKISMSSVNFPTFPAMSSSRYSRQIACFYKAYLSSVSIIINYADLTSLAVYLYVLHTTSNTSMSIESEYYACCAYDIGKILEQYLKVRYQIDAIVCARVL